MLLVEAESSQEAFNRHFTEDMQRLWAAILNNLCPLRTRLAIVCTRKASERHATQRCRVRRAGQIELSYGELVSQFRESERDGKHISGYIVFTEDSFDKPYPIEARTYAVSSNNKAFQPNMGGYSIYGSSLDGADMCVRLENYMEAERGGNDGWRIEKCYTKEDTKEMLDIIAGKFFVCSAPYDSEHFKGLSDEQMQKYMKLFRYPEQFSV